MLKTAIILCGLISVTAAGAQIKPASHTVTVKGIPQGEGRYLRVDITENNQYKSGYYFCAQNQNSVYDYEYFYSQSKEVFHRKHQITFSICQDETATQCQEFATDNYVTYRNAKGFLENDKATTIIDMSSVQGSYQSCQPDLLSNMDELVKKSIHADDRRFSSVG
jgi:hypothetical protein